MKYSDSQLDCIAVLQKEPSTCAQLQAATGRSKDSVMAAMGGLRRAGVVSILEYRTVNTRGRKEAAVYGMGDYEEPEPPAQCRRKPVAVVIRTPHIRPSKWLTCVAQL